MSSIVSFTENTRNTPLYNGVNYNINVLKEYYNNNKQEEVEIFYSDVTTSEDEEEDTPHIKQLHINKIQCKNPLNSEYVGDYINYYDNIKCNSNRPLCYCINKDTNEIFNVYGASKNGYRFCWGLYVEPKHCFYFSTKTRKENRQLINKFLR